MAQLPLPHHHVDIFKDAEKLGFGELHFKIHPPTGLFAIVAIHSTQRGPAIGGCRWLQYPSPREAIYDALRLARGMTLKAAISELAHGGGKAVIIRPTVSFADESAKERYFAAYADFLNELGGIYITAVDSGTSSAEMDIIARYTPYVTSTSAIGNPSIYTAHGVMRGIEAIVQHKFQAPDLNGLHIAIQGIGHVGYRLAKLCHARGMRLTVADHNPLLMQKCVEEFDANVASPEEIHATPCDIFSPCALGGILNARTIAEVRCAMIAGSANNQLATPQAGKLLHRLGVLYAPDYVINAGGLIHASGKYYGATDSQINNHIDHISQTLAMIFMRADEAKKPTSEVADALAAERLTQTSAIWHNAREK